MPEGKGTHTNCLAFIAAAPDAEPAPAPRPICVVLPKFLVAIFSSGSSLVVQTCRHRSASVLRLSVEELQVACGSVVSGGWWGNKHPANS